MLPPRCFVILASNPSEGGKGNSLRRWSEKVALVIKNAEQARLIEKLRLVSIVHHIKNWNHTDVIQFWCQFSLVILSLRNDAEKSIGNYDSFLLGELSLEPWSLRWTLRKATKPN